MSADVRGVRHQCHKSKPCTSPSWSPFEALKGLHGRELNNLPAEICLFLRGGRLQYLCEAFCMNLPSENKPPGLVFGSVGEDLKGGSFLGGVASWYFSAVPGGMGKRS